MKQKTGIIHPIICFILQVLLCHQIFSTWYCFVFVCVEWPTHGVKETLNTEPVSALFFTQKFESGIGSSHRSQLNKHQEMSRYTSTAAAIKCRWICISSGLHAKSPGSTKPAAPHRSTFWFSFKLGSTSTVSRIGFRSTRQVLRRAAGRLRHV